jgi:hypothetical protein
MVSDTTLPIALQSSGAHLPGSEPLRRLVLRCFCSLVSRRLALRLFRREARRIVHLLEELPARQGAVRVLVEGVFGLTPRYWSAFMVADHLHRLVDDTSAVLDALAAGRDGGGELGLGEGQPRVGAGLEAVRRFVASVMDYEARAERLEVADRRARLPHPELGPLCAHAWQCLATLQLWLHRRQVERIVLRLAERSHR